MKHKNHNTKQHSFNKNIFEKIDTEEKAYWLGFLYADGCVGSEINKISLVLSEVDKDHLDKFKKFLDYEGEIRDRPARDSIIRGKTVHSKPMNVISFSSEKMKHDLMNLGCLPQKSLILKFPTKEQVPDYLICHFIRGYFDGDGWFCKSKPKRKFNRPSFSMGFGSTMEFLNELKAVILKNIDVNMSISKHGTIHRLTTGGNVNCNKLSNLLYRDSNISLNRKYEIFEELQNLGVCIMQGENSCLASHFKVKNGKGEILEINNVQIFCKQYPQYNKSNLSFLKRGLQKQHKDLTLA